MSGRPTSSRIASKRSRPIVSSASAAQPHSVLANSPSRLELFGQGLAQRRIVVDDQNLASRVHVLELVCRMPDGALFATARFVIPGSDGSAM